MLATKEFYKVQLPNKKSLPSLSTNREENVSRTHERRSDQRNVTTPPEELAKRLGIIENLQTTGGTG